MKKEDLRGLLCKSHVIVLDVRPHKGWETSERKIKEAVRANPSDLSSWENKYPKDKTLVLYCA